MYDYFGTAAGRGSRGVLEFQKTPKRVIGGVVEDHGARAVRGAGVAGPPQLHEPFGRLGLARRAVGSVARDRGHVEEGEACRVRRVRVRRQM